MRYTYPLTRDLIFKGVFGRDTKESKANLKNLLNAILSQDTQQIIESVEIKNPLLYGATFDEKKPMLDIKAKLDTGELINIEVQVENHEFFKSRAVYYLAKLHGEQLNKGEGYDRIKKTIHIHITRFQVIKTKALHMSFVLMERQLHIPYNDDIELHCLQLPCLDDTIEVEKMDILTKWMTVIKEIDNPKCKQVIGKIISQEEVIRMAVNEYSEVTKESYIKEHMDAIERGELLRRSELNVAIRQGIEQGIEQEKILITKKLHKEGLPLETIIKVTGLSESDIQSIL